MRWPLCSLAAVALATSAWAQSDPRTASLHLFPSSLPAGYTPPEVSASQLHKLLSYHLALPGQRLDGAHWAHPEAWQWIDESSQTSAADLFGASEHEPRKALVVLREDDIDLIPARLAHTHKLSQPLGKDSWTALFDLYAESFGGLVAGIIRASGSAAHRISDWATGASDETQADRALHSLLDTADVLPSGEASFSVLRFDDALDNLTQLHGEDSERLATARASVKQRLEDLVESAGDRTRRQRLALLVVPTSSHDGELAKRDVQDPLELFGLARRADRWTDGQGTWLDSSAASADSTWTLTDTLKNSSKVPKESDYVGKCFASDSDLKKATSDCSGRGKAVLSTKGARRCYVCQCSKTKEKGVSTQWAGEACQKVDLSTSFTLLATTTIGLLATIFISISFLAHEGSRELPSVLTGLSGAKH